MKITLAATAAMACTCACTCTVQAQTAQIYGVVDAGVSYVDNVAGRHLTSVDSGPRQASHWGLRAQEDLGDGLKAIFTLESGINVDLGTQAQGGRGWGRQSFVGLSGSLGTLTLGRHYDFLYVNALPPDMGALAVGAVVGATDGAGTSVDTHMGGTRYDNSIKWMHSIGPWRAGLMTGFGTENGSDRMSSALLGFRQGPLNIGVAYVRDNYVPVAQLAGNKVWATTAHYDLSSAVKLVASYADGRQSSGPARNRRLQLGTVLKPTDLSSVGIVLARANTAATSGAEGHINQIAAGYSYFASKRVELYAIGSLVKVGGANKRAYTGVPAIGGSAATHSADGDHQSVLRTGVRYVF